MATTVGGEMAPANVNQLVRQAKAGNSQAVAALYQQYATAIYRYIYYRVPTSSDAEDLTAEVFLKMVEGLPKYNITGAPFEAWLYRIAAARVADFHRRAHQRPQDELSEHLADYVPLPEEQLQETQEAEVLRQMLRQFSEEDQNILILRFVERKSHKDVASLLGKTVSAVKSAQHRALVLLADRMGAEGKIRHYLRGGDE